MNGKISNKDSAELHKELDLLIIKKNECKSIHTDLHAIAVQLAEQHLRKIHEKIEYDDWKMNYRAGKGIDIVGYSNKKEKIIAEVKTTDPSEKEGTELGGEQGKQIKKDLDKMKKHPTALKYFFIIDDVAKTAVIKKFEKELQGITILTIKEL